jgi:hypothetical protein
MVGSSDEKALIPGALRDRIFKPAILLKIAAVIVGALLLLWLLDKIFLYLSAKSYVEEISSSIGLSRHAASILTWVVFALTAFFAGCVISFSGTKRKIGLAGLFALVIAQPAVLLYFDKPFDSAGVAQKCYVITRDDIRYGDRVGKDPSTGLDCKPLTPEIAERFDRYSRGERPAKLESKDNPVFFSQRTGNPVVWYSRDKNGIVEAFDLMGFNPASGEELQPVTAEIVDVWKTQSRAPEPLDPDEDTQFFDPVSGRSLVWYQKSPSGAFQFYNRPGFNPRTGTALVAVDAKVIEEWKAYKAAALAKRCYVLTRNSVKYGSGPGIDAETGRPCRTFTAEMLERLREYEKGNRPKRIESSDPTFFDLRSGEPAIWYATNKTGNIELFSLMGFHPDTGAELLPITAETVALWRDQQKKINTRVSRRIDDPASYVFFDQKTGDPRAWYWRGPGGQYEFYDAPGFHPRTGDQLTVLTKELVIKIAGEEEVRLAAAKAADEARNQAEAAAATVRANELKAATEAGRICDELAANPNDANKAGDGVAFEALKLRAKEALDACELAVRQAPSENRFQYQLARVLQLSDRKRAGVILQGLVAKRYPAAFDNFGWMAYVDRKNPQEAAELFRRGVDLGDADSMVSLAEMIDRGHAQPRSSSETKLSLYMRASEMGHQAATRAVAVEQQKADTAERNKIEQIQQQQMAAQVFGIILQGMARR